MPKAIHVRFALIAAVAAATRLATAQSVVGTVVLPDSITPLAGAIVAATDVRGVTIGRALTGRRGEFTLRLPAGSARITVLRIGFRPTEGPRVIVPDTGSRRVRIVAGSTPVSLAALGVRERETCRVSADSGLAVARVWDEARKAMLSSQLSSSDAPLFAEWIEYDRTLDSTGSVVRKQQIRSSRNPTTRAFRSVPAEDLRDQGFVIADREATTYYAPDAEALLSDAFVSGHCFQLVESPTGDSRVLGVAFVPTRDRRFLREIEGTLWVDRATAELRSLDFRYLNLPDAAVPADPGGRVEFRRLADGHWFVNRWNVRMPRLGQRDMRSATGTARTTMTLTPTILRAVQVTGGEVTRAMRGDSIMYQATGPSVRVQVVARDSALGFAGATLTLEGTDYAGTVDTLGQVSISPVLAGRYRARVRTPLMDVLGLPSVERDVVTRIDARADTVSLPMADVALRRVCNADSVHTGDALLHGRVRDERGVDVKGATVTAMWLAEITLLGTGANENLSYSEKTARAQTNAEGRWRLCGVPSRAAVTLSVVSDSGFQRERIAMRDRLIVSADVVVQKVPALMRQINADKATPIRATVEIVVTDERGAPLPATSLEVQTTNANTRTVVTGPTGVALVPDVAFGRFIVRARRMGMAEGRVTVTVDSARVVVPIVMSDARAPMLDEVRVVGARVLASRHSAFEARLASGAATAAFTREDIEKRNPPEIWHMLANVRGVTVTDREDQVVATTGRGMQANFDFNQPCFLKVVVDGVPLPRTPSKATLGFDLRQLPRPHEIHGIEVFAGPASIPLEYGGTGDGKWCGLIAIWTR